MKNLDFYKGQYCKVYNKCPFCSNGKIRIILIILDLFLCLVYKRGSIEPIFIGPDYFYLLNFIIMTDYREQTGRIFRSLRNTGLRSKFVVSFVLTLLVSSAVLFSGTVAVSANEEFVFGLETSETKQHQQEVFSDSPFATENDDLTEAQIAELEAQIIELQLEVIRLLELIIEDLEAQIHQQNLQTGVTTPQAPPVVTSPTVPVTEVPPVTDSDDLEPNDDQVSDPADPDEEDQDESPADDEDAEREVQTNALAAFFGVPPERSSLFTTLFFLILIAGSFFVYRSWNKGDKVNLPIIMGGAGDRNQTGGNQNPTHESKEKHENKNNNFNKDRRDDRQNKGSSRR